MRPLDDRVTPCDRSDVINTEIMNHLFEKRHIYDSNVILIKVRFSLVAQSTKMVIQEKYF